MSCSDRSPFVAAVFILLLSGCDQTDSAQAYHADSGTDYTEAVALIDLLGEDTYRGFRGGLYSERGTGFGTNTPPPGHDAHGRELGNRVEPLGALGQPSADGVIVLLSISTSNATREWCHRESDGSGVDGNVPCNTHSFMGRVAADSSVGVLNPRLRVVNGAKSGSSLDHWDDPNEYTYNRIQNQVLPHFGITEAQVQVVWLKLGLKDQYLFPPLPDSTADAFNEAEVLGNVYQALRVRYPNLKQVFVTSRIYGGWARPTSSSPEPWAYETGFGAKWAIERQILDRESAGAGMGTMRRTRVPFLGWGPYLWSYGDRPRSDGLIWPADHFDGDRPHASAIGEAVVADSLINFFRTSPYTHCWFLQSSTSC